MQRAAPLATAAPSDLCIEVVQVGQAQPNDLLLEAGHLPSHIGRRHALLHGGWRLVGCGVGVQRENAPLLFFRSE